MVWSVHSDTGERISITDWSEKSLHMMCSCPGGCVKKKTWQGGMGQFTIRSASEMAREAEKIGWAVSLDHIDMLVKIYMCSHAADQWVEALSSDPLLRRQVYLKLKHLVGER